MGDLLAEKSGATGRWMANALRFDIKFFQLSGCDFSQRDNLVARK
jgi:hypothetical protein